MVTVTNLSICINKKPLIQNISCNLLPGTITIFIGPSGAGKTTLLQTIAGLISPARGEIIINNQSLNTLSISKRAEQIGYVFQDFNLFKNLTVLQNCVDPLLVKGINKSQAEQDAKIILEQVGMKEFVNSYPSELSGGQKQRVAITRALCLKPKIMLLDEPTASLDPNNTQILVTILKKLAADGLTIGLSSQEMSFVRAVFDRIYYIDNGTITASCENKQDLSSHSVIAAFVAM